MKLHTKGFLYSILAFFFIVLSTIVQKILVGSMSIGLILIIAGICMMSFFSLLHKKPITWNVVDILRVGFLGFGLPLSAMIYGFTLTSGTVGGIMVQFQSIATIIFAVWLLKETLSKKHLVGALLMFVGGVLTSLSSSVYGSTFTGNFIIFLGSLGIGYGYVESKRLLKRHETYAINIFKGMGTAVVGVFFFLLTTTTSSFNPELVVWFVVFIISGYLLNHYFLIRALSLEKAWEVGIASQTYPLFIVLFGFLILGETLNVVQWLGVILLVCGGIIISYDHRH